MPGSPLIVRQLMHWRQLLAGVAVLLALALGAGTSQLDFDSTLGVLLGQSDPYLAERDRLRADFSAALEVSFLLHDPATDDAFSLATLNALAELQRRYRSIPGARRIASLLNYHGPVGEVSIVPFPWQGMERFSAEDISLMRQRALDDPLVNGLLISPDAALAMVLVTLTPDVADNRTLDQALHQLLDELRQNHPQVNFYASAEALFEQSTRRAMINDLIRLLPLAIFCCVLLVAWCFRSLLFGLAVLLVAMLTSAMTLGSVGWLGPPLNVISIMAPLVVVIIAVADAVHIISVYRQQLQRGDGMLAAMQHSLSFNLRPITLATVTTAIGFASLNLVSAPALSQFGSIVALGVLFAWLVTLLLLPALVIWISRLQQPVGETRLTRPLIQLSLHLNRQHHRGLFAAGVMLGLLGLLLLPLNEVDFDRMDFIPAESPLHAYQSLLNTHSDTGPLLVYGIDGLASDIAITPAFLQQVDQFAAWLRQQGEVTQVVSLVEVVSTIHESLHPASEDPQRGGYRIPADQATIRQHLSDYQLVQNERFALGNFINRDYSTIQLFISTRHLSNRELVELDQRLSAAFDTFLPAATLLHGSGTLLFARMDHLVTMELMRGYALSLLMITLTLMVGLRSWRYGLLSLIPNVMPAVIVFGAWGLLDGQLDPFVLMLFSISIGLVVDDTVHILGTVQRQQRQGQGLRAAVNVAVSKAGPALIITTAVLALGSFILMAAETLYFQQAARLLVPIVVVALLLDLIWLPTLLRRLRALRGL